MTIQPVGDRILIKPDSENAASKIIIPEAFKKFGTRGTVVAVGPGRRYLDGVIHPLQPKPGDRVVFSKMHNFPFKNGDEEMIITPEEGVLCILKDDSKHE